MTRRSRFAGIALVVAIGVLAAPRSAAHLSAAADPHSYFNSLVASAAHWKSLSFRDPKQLDYPKNGGYAQSNTELLRVTYAPSSDTNAERQDAAKIVIPAFAALGVLAAPMSATTTLITLSKDDPAWAQDRAVKVDNEIMVVQRTRDNCGIGTPPAKVINADGSVTLQVCRGQFGTVATSHSSGSTTFKNVNSLQNQLRFPLGTQDARTYLFTWDVYFTQSFLRTGLTNHKAFQFTTKSAGTQWFEPNTRYSGAGYGSCPGFDPAKHVSSLVGRVYGGQATETNWALTNGDNYHPMITTHTPVTPWAGTKCLFPSRWTRWWVMVKQRAYDWDEVSMWVADEVEGPVLIYDKILLSVSPNGETPNQIINWWVEFNTSEDKFVRGDSRDLVAYIRNFVALHNIADPTPLLLRPLAGSAPPIIPTLQPPSGLRIIGG